MAAYYNEIDPFAAAWLRELIKLGEIAPGDVDERSIIEVQPDDLRGYTQCHFFAGIGGWSYAARLAGWPDDAPLWTGSCPCQPFSVAGKGAGTDDDRHLWPDFVRLIAANRPPVVVGEQVAGKAGYGWFDGVRADLAGEDYASRCVDIPACAMDAPHIRQRLYWCAVADSNGSGSPANGRNSSEIGSLSFAQCGADDRAAVPGRGYDQALDHLADAEVVGSGTGLRKTGTVSDGDEFADRDGGYRVLAGTRGDLAFSKPGRCEGRHAERTWSGATHAPNGSFWSGSDWIACHDGKARRTEPGVPLLANGVSGRVAKWRGFGNAIVPQIAAEVLASLMDVGARTAA